MRRAKLTKGDRLRRSAYSRMSVFACEGNASCSFLSPIVVGSSYLLAHVLFLPL